MYAASGVPFSIFVLTTFFRQLPVELEEAAHLDGASDWQTFWRVMVPLVRPALATVAVFRFVPIWNDFLFPLVLLRDDAKYTLPVGLTAFTGENATNFSAVFAGLVITTVPAHRPVPRRHQADRRRIDGGHGQVIGSRP